MFDKKTACFYLKVYFTLNSEVSSGGIIMSSGFR